jgi:hypothetical protein
MRKIQLRGATLVAMMVAAMHAGCALPTDEDASDVADEHVGDAASALTVTPFEDLGGTLVGAPAAASMAPGRLDAFVRGTDNALWHYWYESGVWRADTQGSDGGLTSAPAVASWGPGKLDIFVRGADYALHHIGYDAAAGGWASWENLGGYLTSAPAVASSRPGRLDVFVLGGGGTLWRRTYDGGWQGWSPLGQPPGGGTWKFDPAATKSADGGGVDVFLVGPGNDLLTNRFSVGSGPAWNPGAWTSWGGYVNATPAVASWPGHVEAYVVGGGPGGTWPLFRRGIDTITGDSGFQSLGGDYRTAVAITADVPGRTHLFATANDDHSLLHALAYPTSNIEDLARAFAPRIWLHGEEAFFPSSVDDFLPYVHTESRTDGQYYVTNQALGCDSCTEPPFLRGKNPTQSQVPAYVEIVDRRQNGQPTGVTDLVYWTFYPYNNGKRVCIGEYFDNYCPLYCTWPFSGSCCLPRISGCAGSYTTAGNHVGDWEHVTVRLVNGQPTQVALSQHSGSQIFNYGDPALQLVDGHPVAYAALGSHGLYADAARHTYKTLPNSDTLNDDTGAGTLWRTEDALVAFRPQAQTGSLSWLNYPGRWGNPKSGCSVLEPISGECVLNDGPASIQPRLISNPDSLTLE